EQRRIRYSTLTANDTVVAFAYSFPAVFENILRVLPDTKTVAVVNGNSPNEKFWLEEIRREARRFANRITLEVRKAMLASILAKASLGIRFNEHIEGDGPAAFAHACKLGLEGVVSKRKDSDYRSGRSPDWLKMKNSDAPAFKREAEEEWGKKKWR